MKGLRFILYGRNDAETDSVKRVLDRQEIPYRFEGGLPSDEVVALSTPAGRFFGLHSIEAVFG